MTTEDLKLPSNTTEWRKKNPEKAKALRVQENNKRRGHRIEEGRKYWKRIKESPELLAENRKYQRNWRKNNRPRLVATRRFFKQSIKKYGLTLEQYDKLLEQQNNCCAICHTTDWGIKRGKPIGPAIDHCHTTNKVRGLLCELCNRGLGMFRDNIEALISAAIYLGGSKLGDDRGFQI